MGIRCTTCGVGCFPFGNWYTIEAEIIVCFCTPTREHSKIARKIYSLVVHRQQTKLVQRE